MPDSPTGSPDEVPARIHLDANARFVPTRILRDAYVRYAGSRAPDAPPFVRFEDRGLELGIVASQVPAIARAVSSVLSCSLEDAKDEHGGHLPRAVVERVQRDIISPQGVAFSWGEHGHRFVLSRPLDAETSEVVATILVARRKGTVFFFTGRYNCIRHSTMVHEIDFAQPDDGDPTQRWFDRFAFPPVEQFKPRGYHHIANFVVAKQHRAGGLSRFLLDAIVRKYARNHLQAQGAPIEHSQFLLCGHGFWQIGDPPWLARMEKLGFRLRWGAESFFRAHEWAPLPPTKIDGRSCGNGEYNAMFGLPRRYLEHAPPPGPEHLRERIPEVVRLATQPNAKLQYFQTMFDFV